MGDAKTRFQQLAAQEAEERRKQEEAERKRQEQIAQRKSGGQTKIGTTKGQIKAFATAFEAIADGDDVEITMKSGGWNQSNVTSDSRGKWEGGPAGMSATRIKKEQPQGPPPKKSITEFK
ncbi:SH3 domain-containing protein [Balamuthia mandrillaris]